MKEDKIPKIVNAAKEQPMKSSDDTDSAVTGKISSGKMSGIAAAGEPMKVKGDKMSHEGFQDKMTKSLC